MQPCLERGCLTVTNIYCGVLCSDRTPIEVSLIRSVSSIFTVENKSVNCVWLRIANFTMLTTMVLYIELNMHCRVCTTLAMELDSSALVLDPCQLLSHEDSRIII